VQHTDDHRRLVYAADLQGSEYCRIYLKDLASGVTTDTGIDASTGDFAVSPDSRWLFWVFRDENGRSSRIYRRPLEGGEDALVDEEADEGMFLSVGVSSSRAWILISSGNRDTTETRLIDAADPTATPRVVEPRTEGLRYSVEHRPERRPARTAGDHHTDADGAVDFQLCLTDALPHRDARTGGRGSPTNRGAIW
jgi:oligopeptidase B